MGNHSCLQAAPEGPAEVAFGYMRDVERLFAFRFKTPVFMQRTVVLGTVFPDFAQELQSRVLVRRDYHFGQQCRFLPHGDLQSCHGTGCDLKPLGVITDGGEDELRLIRHIDPQGVRSACVGGRSDLRAPEMNIDVRDRFAGRLIDHFADDDRLRCKATKGTKKQSTKYKGYYF